MVSPLEELLERVRGNPGAYAAAQRELPKYVPAEPLSFAALRGDPDMIFHDVTPALVALGAAKYYPERGATYSTCVAIHRGRGWGKTVLLDAWLAFLRGEREPFKGTWAEHHPRPEKIVGVSLDLSSCDSLGQFVAHMVERVNQGLALAGIEERVSVRIAEPESLLVEPANSCSFLKNMVFDQLEEICRPGGHHVALAIDEYDSMTIRAVDSPAVYQERLEFFARFYMSLKARSSVFRFRLLTGESRLDVLGPFWSSANDIEYTTLQADTAAALGCTWEQIESLYEPQLRLLEAAHGLDRPALRAEIEDWYGRHRWTIESPKQVFNPWGVRGLMATGRFEPHRAGPGPASQLFRFGWAAWRVARALTGKELSLPGQFLAAPVSPRPGADGRLELGDSEQLALLVSSGALAVHPEHVDGDGHGSVRVRAPNRAAEASLVDALVGAVLGRRDHGLLDLLDRHVRAPTIARLLADPAMRRALSRAIKAAPLPGANPVRKPPRRISLALAVAMLAASAQRRLGYRAGEACAELDPKELQGQAADALEGKPPRALTPQRRRCSWEEPPSVGHVFCADGVAHLLEVRMILPGHGRRLRAQLGEALQHCLSCQLVELPGFPGRLFSAHVFDARCRHLVGTPPLGLAEAHRLAARLLGDGPLADAGLEVLPGAALD